MINLNTPSKDKSKQIHSASEQPSNAGRRKMLSVGMGAAASASLGGFGLLVPGAARAVDYSTTTSCTSLYTAFDNLPKMEIIYVSGSVSGSEDCTLIDSVSRTKLVGYDSKNHKAYSGILTQIKKAGVKYPTQTWTLKSSATLEIVNGEWTSNYYDETGKRLLRLTKDELLNPLTYYKPWSHTKVTTKVGHDEYRRRLADNPPTNIVWTQAEENARLIAELKRVFVEWFERLQNAGRYNSAAGAPRAFRLDRGVADINIYVPDVLRSLRVGNEPYTYLQVDVETVRGYDYRMYMVRNVRAPNVIEYRVSVVDMQALWGNPFIQNPTTSAGPTDFIGQARTDIDNMLRGMNQFTSSQSERMGLYTGTTEVVSHRLVPPSVERFSMMPFNLINALIGFGSLPDANGVPPAFQLPPELINHVTDYTLSLNLLERLRDLMNQIDDDVSRGFPWLTFRFNDEDARHRRLIGYTQDRAYPKQPVTVPVTGQCNQCPNEPVLTNDAW